MSTNARFLPPEPSFVPHSLDASQQKVLDWDGRDSLTVWGAPGSGKTTTAVEFVASALDRKLFRVDEVLVLSPQRLAATRLRAALADRIRRATPGPLARTPMSLALEIATEAAVVAGDVPPRLLTGAEHDRILAQLIQGELLDGTGDYWGPTLSPGVRGTRVFRNELRDLFDRCISHGVLPEVLRERGLASAIPEWVAAATFWSSQLIPILESYRYGFADSAEIMRQATTGVAQGHAATGVKAVIVDDAHELPRGAVALLAAFAGRGVPVVVFGNPDESTTTFRGALPQVIGHFEALVGVPARALRLTHVYRHGEDIRSVVGAIEGRIGAAGAGTQRSTPVATVAPEARVTAITASSRAGELAHVARHLRRAHVRDAAPWSQMAVVVRQGSLVDSVARLLAANEVPTRTLMNEQALRDQPLVREFISVIGLATRPEDLTPARAEALLAGDLGGMTAVDIRRLRLILRHHELAEGGSRTGPELLRDALMRPEVELGVNAPPVVAARAVAQLLARVREQISSGGTIEEILWTIWNESPLPRDLPEQSRGFGLVAEQANRRLDTVLALFAAARRFVEREPSRTAIDFVTDLLHTDVPEDTLAPSAVSDAVLVCTPTALVGHEVDVIAVVAVQEGVWPNMRPRGQLFRASLLDAAFDPSTSRAVDSTTQVDPRLDVLHDELRMFAMACSRSRRHLIVSATRSDDMTVSPFHRLVASVRSRPDASSDDSVPIAHHETSERDESGDYPLSLSGMTGWLRRRLAEQFDRDDSTALPKEPEVADGMARLLARLAQSGVSGADPEEWYGSRAPSTRLPLVTEEEIREGNPVPISPSRLESWTENQLGWFIETTVGGDQTVATGVGTLLHKAFEQAGAKQLADLRPETLWRVVDERWHELSFEADWLGERERGRAEEMIRNLAGYLQGLEADGVEIIGVECRFDFVVGNGRLRGRIDQVHRLPDGTVRIVDLKTGKSAKSVDDVATNAQLRCYQLALVRDAITSDPAFTDGANARTVAEGAPSAGASLVYVDAGLVSANSSATLRHQAPMERGGAAEEEAASDIAEAAKGMAGDTFEAVVFTREERSEYASRYLRRIHTVRAVSSS